jgi:hypothetical protein
MNLLRKWFPPKWKLKQVTTVRKSTGPNWIGQAIIEKDGAERLVQRTWKREPKPAEVKAFARAEAKRRNLGGEKHAFNLRQKGIVVATVHGAWTDDDNFEIAELIQVGPAMETNEGPEES